jgi:exodeoxyribonuclease VII small subunit
MDNLTFEQALQQLEETVMRLEDGELTLEESLALFERGQQLARFCTRQLDAAVLRVEQLSADGEIVEIE